MASDDEDGVEGGLFAEPDGYFAPDPVGKVVSIPRANGKDSLELSLAPKHSLWGHEGALALVWNASKVYAEYFDKGELSVQGLSVLELGAGAGLPSFIAALNGARKVVVTDYESPSDHALVDALRDNAKRLEGTLPNGVVAVEGFTWGKNPAPLLAHVQDEPAQRAAAGAPDSNQAAGPSSRKFDRIILSDVLFNRQSHPQLLATLAACLAADGVVWCTFSHHDPHKAPLDMNFFALAVLPEYGFAPTHVRDIEFERDLFVENDGLDDERRIVHFWELRFASAAAGGGGGGQ